MDSVVNKTPLSKRTNIQVGKKAPSVYLARFSIATDHARRTWTPFWRRTSSTRPSFGVMISSVFTRLSFEQLLQRIESAMGKQIAREPGEATVTAGEETIDYEGAAAPDEEELSPEEVETMEEELSPVG